MMIENWVAVVSLIVITFAALYALIRFGAGAMADIVHAANNNEQLKNAIEMIGKSAPPEVVSALVGGFSVLQSLSANNNELIRAINELKAFTEAVTDGLPNDPPVDNLPK